MKYKEYLKNIARFDMEYSETCCCGKENKVITQIDDSCEYYAEVVTECSNCGEAVFFSLPVN